MQPQSKTAFMFQNYRCSLHGGYTERKISIFTLIDGGRTRKETRDKQELKEELSYSISKCGLKCTVDHF